MSERARAIRMQKGAIGVFDSGVGGLTVVRELRRHLPQETILYLGDTARVPYGNKSRETVLGYAREALTFLQTAAKELAQRRKQADADLQEHGGLKLVVVACNTVSAVALETLRSLVRIPVVGVIRPAVQRATSVTKTKTIAVIGTEGTIRSRAYQRTLEEFDPGLEVVAQPCPLLVPLVEEGWLDHPVTRLTLQTYLEDFARWETDTLILGCTHYPLLAPQIGSLLGEQVHLINSAQSTAQDVAALLQKRDWRRPQSAQGELLCFVTDTAQRFRKIAQRFLGEKPESVEFVELSRFTNEQKEG